MQMKTLPRSLKRRSLKKVNSILLPLMLLSGCGDSDDSSVKSGVFVDSAVEGVTYISGDLSGVTDSDGRFEYQSGQTVTFMVGDIVLGQAVGDDLITPVDLVEDAEDSSHTTVLNIARFLQTLDDDGNPDNGIKILQMISDAAQNKTIDFTVSSEAFEANTNVLELVNELTQLTNAGQRSLVSLVVAKAHLESSIQFYLQQLQDDKGNGGIGSNGDFGEISLSGDDTDKIGNKLMVGSVYFFSEGEYAAGQPEFVIAMNEGATLDNKLPSISDPSNFFILNLLELGVSMKVVKNGNEYGYVCNMVGGVQSCGSGFDFDSASKRITFDNVTVDGVDSGNLLTLNGSIKLP